MHWEKFEALYDAHSRRVAADALRSRCDAIVGGLWANSNMDGDGKGTPPREAMLVRVDNWLEDGLMMIYSDEPEKPLEEDPFFAGMKVPAPDRLDNLIDDGYDDELGVDQG
jgi:hypothetical protein